MTVRDSKAITQFRLIFFDVIIPFVKLCLLLASIVELFWKGHPNWGWY
jgi:hypothetical protein